MESRGHAQEVAKLVVTQYGVVLLQVLDILDSAVGHGATAQPRHEPRQTRTWVRRREPEQGTAHGRRGRDKHWWRRRPSTRRGRSLASFPLN